MASIVSYMTRDGRKLWRVRYRKPGSNRSTDRSGFTRKVDATNWAALNTVNILDDMYVDPRKGRVTINDLAPAWLAKKKIALKPSYYKDIIGTWNKYIRSEWGDRQIKTLKRGEIQEWITQLSADETDDDGNIIRKGKSASVVIRANSVLAGILDDAVKDKRLNENPARDITLPRKQRTSHVYLTQSQLLSLSEHCRDTTHSVLILVLGLCGLRWGEAIGLRPRDVDFHRHRLNVSRSATQVGTKMVVGTPKNGRGRSVVFPALLDEPLKQLAEGKDPDAPLFPGPLDGYMRQVDSPKGRLNWFSSACDRAGLKRMTIHDLRHTAASLMVKSGANVKAVQRQLGHSSAAMTLDIYADLFDSDLDEVGDAMNNLLLRESVGFLWDSLPETAA